MKRTWMFIVGGDPELAEKIDPATVKLIEAKAPMVSFADKEDIVRGFQDGTIFCQVGEGATRTRLQQNVLAVNGMITSIRTFLADTLYLEDSHVAMKVLIDPTRCQTREALRHMWRGSPTNRVVLEYADGWTEAVNIPMEEEGQFQIAYIQLWMFSMRNYPRLTNLVPKTDGKHKVSCIGPDLEWQRGFAAIAKAFGFESTAINLLLEEDPDRVNVRDMLSKARPPNRFEYDLQAETQSHCELLHRIQVTQQQPRRGVSPRWTTDLSNVTKKRRYGRPYERALKECNPCFFFHNICQAPPSGRYITDLFIKRSILQFFFQMPALPADLSLWRGVDLETTDRHIQRAVHEAAQAAITLRLEDAEKRLAAQQEENVHNMTRLSEARESSAGQLAQIQHYQKRIDELETVERNRTREESRQQLELAEKLRQSQQTIETLERTIADHESAREMQVVLAKQHQDQRGMANELEKCRLMIAEFERRISEYKSESDRQALAAESLRSRIVEWERGDIRRPEDQNADKMSQGYQQRAAELALLSQKQAADLTKSNEAADEKGRILNVILSRIKQTREGVEMLSTAFTERLQFEPNYESSNRVTIHPDELPFEDLPGAEAQVEDLEKSIAKFIAIYSLKNLAQDENPRVKMLELQKLAPNARLAIADGSGAEVDTEAPDLNQMLAVVSRRAEVLEQEGRAVHDLQAELDMARAAAESQQQKAERVERLEEELAEAEKQLQQEQVATRDLGESLKTARDAMQREIELTSVLRGELDTAKAKNEALLQQGKAAVAELTAELTTVKADAEVLQKEAERVHGLEAELNDSRTALQATGSAQEELEKTRQDLENLRQLSGSYIKELKTAKADAEKRLEASKSRIIGLEKDLEAARQSIKERETELAGLKLDIDDDDERVRLLKAQLFETNRLIQLEKEKKKLEAEQKEIQAAVAEAKASSSQDLGELMQQEAHVDASLSQVEEKMVATGLDVMRYAKYKVRFESSKTGRQTGVDYVLVEDLEKKFEALRDQVVYCFVNGIMTVVELGKYKDFLANQKHLADHGEFFYCGYNPPRKRHRGLDDAGEDLKGAAGPRAQELARLRAKSKGPALSSPFVFGSRQEEG
jgi:hypothetical protein